MIRLADVPWSEAKRALAPGFVALLPVGSTEAHGPHLPLGSDVIIAEAMAMNAASLLEAQGQAVALLPSLAYGVTECAAEFFGTLSIAPATLQALIGDLARALARLGCGRLGLANGHLEPDHRRALRAAAQEATAAGLRTVCPDVVRGLYAKRLGAEFVSGACHAGSYEGSIVLAARPELVREGTRRALADNPISLGAALAAGQKTFLAAGGPHAYFGAPAAADPAAGRTYIAELGAILAEEMGAP